MNSRIMLYGRAMACVLWCSFAAPVHAGAVSFTKSALANTGEVMSPTSLQFGPDDRLYVSQQDGKIHVFTIAQISSGQYTVVASETIDLVHSIANHNDDGTLNATVKRQCTGLLVTGTAQNPVIYVTSSDWRIAVGTDSGLDTNSGVISRLTWDGTQWVKLDLVRGLPRSEENHAANGMALDGSTLYVAQGGNTNMGAPSNNFGGLPEYALSAAILSVDLAAIGETTHDLATLDDPTRTDVEAGIDENDPFGGNDGANQAKIVPGGPVQVYAPGFRNPYDVVLTTNGRMYTIDNGPNASWGGPPTDCTNAMREENSATNPDGLHFVTGAGYYGGHPNPFRANVNNKTNDQSPVTTSNAVECGYLQPGVTDGALTTWPVSVNGLTEYTASNFGGAMQGDLLAAGYNGNAIYRIELNAAGDGVVASTTLFPTVGTNTLDVTTLGDGDIFPGTVWVTDHAQGVIYAFEPADAIFCTGADLPGIDEDNDGYMNDDEIASGTDPCSQASVPADNDGDFISNLFDDDDDNDGMLDFVDAFAIDAVNGLSTTLPVDFGWGVGDPGFGIAGLGFTGMMSDGVTDWALLFDPARLTPGGAAGKFTIDNVTAGDAIGPANTQDSAFQLGVAVTASTGLFVVSTRVDVPNFGAEQVDDGRAVGLFFGDGSQHNFVRLAIEPEGNGYKVSLVHEDSDVPSQLAEVMVPGLSSALTADLSMLIDPEAGTVQAFMTLDGGVQEAIGSVQALSGTVLAQLQGPNAIAVGVIASSRGGAIFHGTWDYLRVMPMASTAHALVRIDPPGAGIHNSTFVGGSFGINNLSTGGQRISRVTVDLRTSIFEDMNFDIDGTGGDSVFKVFTPTSDSGVGLTGNTYLAPHAGGGFDALEVNFGSFDRNDFFSFAIDVDPHHIVGAPSPGPGGAGHIAGIELAGATWTIDFDDGTTLVTRVFPKPGSDDGSANTASAPAPSAPALTLLGAGAGPVTVLVPQQSVHVTGPTGAEVRIVRIEGGRFVDGLVAPETVGAYQANVALAIQELSATIGVGGFVDVPLTLTRSAPEGGLNLFVSAIVDGAGPDVGAMSNLMIVQLGCTADVNGDNMVNLDDLQLLLFGFGSTGPGDVNGDGFVDLADLQLMLSNFGMACT